MNLNDPSAEVRLLPTYPSAMRNGPFALTYLEHLDLVAACGSDFNYNSRECYSFDGVNWQNMTSLAEIHCPNHFRIVSSISSILTRSISNDFEFILINFEFGRIDSISIDIFINLLKFDIYRIRSRSNAINKVLKFFFISN